MSARRSTLSSPRITSGAMYPGVPDVICCAVTTVSSSARSSRLTRPKSRTLTKSVLEPHAARVDVGRLDVAVDETAGVRVRERVADLLEQVDRAVGRQRPELPHERVEVAPLEQFHRVVEHALPGRAEVEQPDGVRRTEARGGLGFALELVHRAHGVLVAAAAKTFGPHELDRRAAREPAVTRAPDLPHSPRPISSTSS